MGKETGFNRKQKQYIVEQRRKLVDRKRLERETGKPKATVQVGEVTQKKLRREEKKLQIKLAKKDAKRRKRDGMKIEEGDAENVDEEM